VHADETKVNIKGTNWYVWVFTDERHVIFKLTETRESTIVHDMLSTYRGILISDFYPGFTTGHFFQRLNCNIESHRNRGVFTQQVIKQSQSELEQTEITAVAPMDNTDPTVLLTQRTEIDNPDVG
jgi:Transposase IS66 family